MKCSYQLEKALKSLPNSPNLRLQGVSSSFDKGEGAIPESWLTGGAE